MEKNLWGIFLPHTMPVFQVSNPAHSGLVAHRLAE